MTIERFNQQEEQTVREQLFTCCGSNRWVDELMKHYPFASEKDLLQHTLSAWYDTCNSDDWLEAFSQHPKIGDIETVEEKFASTKHLAGAEQAGVATASSSLIEALAKANKSYHVKYRFTFIVCATGKSGDEMLRMMDDRLRNTYKDELHIAANEQMKITIIRLKKLLYEADWSFLPVSQITTHVLDTSIGKPARNITIALQQEQNNSFHTIAQGVTNHDGRIADLLPPGRIVEGGNYKMIFETADYHQSQQVQSFYPRVEIQFSVFDGQHYHVPLLLNPYGYSTYRGS
ncbi:hydroxyisourate hydrolase [Aridibaculum aurantiacum]|uniref:hydroxyisourate hydrolase n=1 Tax=Aridibaculum aurantiacum TaxID=2810307 RepID=UPI001F613A88|nr:hydroxyisourate hydrolase [Aridibaculum aurantiacum]